MAEMLQITRDLVKMGSAVVPNVFAGLSGAQGVHGLRQGPSALEQEPQQTQRQVITRLYNMCKHVLDTASREMPVRSSRAIAWPKVEVVGLESAMYPGGPMRAARSTTS